MTTEEFICDKLRQKYNDIWPLIRLALYSSNEYGKIGLLQYDGRWPGDKSIGYQITKPIRYILYQLKSLCNQNFKEDGIFFSDTVLRSNRYRGMLNEIYANYNVIASGSMSNIINKSIFKMDPLNRKIFYSRKLFFGESISGISVKYAMRRTRDLFAKLIKESKVCADEYEEVDKCFHTLQIVANQRINDVGLLLKKTKVKCFITINQFNLRDTITIMACRKSGIWTKELSHYTWCLLKSNYGVSSENWFLLDHNKRFSSVNESCQWSIAEKRFCEKYDKFDALYNDLQISEVGCPEVTKNEFIKNTAKYKKENALLIFTPSIPYIGGGGDIPSNDPKRLQSILSKNRDIYQKVALLAKKHHMKVYVRHHPSEQKYHTEIEQEFLDTLGFKVLSSSREDFIKAVCVCKVAIGYMTSAFISALIYGCKCYALVFDGDEGQFDYCGLDIHGVKPEEIPNIVFESGGNYVPVNYIDIDRLCSYPSYP